MQVKRMYHSIRLLLLRSPKKRAAYLKKNDILGGIGEGCYWGPWWLPLYPKMIVLHNNVHVHKTAKLVPHDMINRFFSQCDPNSDYGYKEKVGCIELMDNVYVSMNVTVMNNVRINHNCIVSAGSVVSSDIPQNTIASGVPAKPVGRFDMFMALRKMNKRSKPIVYDKKSLDELAKTEWERFYKRHDM